MIFRSRQFPQGKVAARNKRGGKLNRWPILLVISVPKIFVNGQFYFNLSSKMWSHVFWNTVYIYQSAVCCAHMPLLAHALISVLTAPSGLIFLQLSLRSIRNKV